MVYDVGQYQQTRQGPVKVTGNPLDVALNGPGYFGVQTPDGLIHLVDSHRYWRFNLAWLKQPMPSPVE